MSNALAIASVTAVLRDLLINGIIDHDLTPSVGDVKVTALPPDRITTGDQEQSQLNLFLYQVTPNLGWRNVGLPSRNRQGQSIAGPPLALDLHYLLTAYGARDFHAEILLGYAMQLFHETPVLAREAIRTALGPPTLASAGGGLPATLQALSTSELADQIEQIKICPQSLNTEEFSKLWTALQARYRTTAAYHVSVVLIDSRQPARTPLPVLTRGKDDSGVSAQGNLILPFPTIDDVQFVEPQTGELRPMQPRVSVELGDRIAILGHHFAGSDGDKNAVTVTVRLSTPRLNTPKDILVPAGDRGDRRITVQIPNEPANCPAGFYLLSVLVMPNNKPEETRETNEWPLLIAPKITSGLPLNVARVNVVNNLGEATINLSCSPEVRPEQRVMLTLGDREVRAEPHTAQTNALSFVAKQVRADTFRLRLRVDGIDSHLLDLSDPAKPKFDESKKVTIT